jgi:hypothetical protein
MLAEHEGKDGGGVDGRSSTAEVAAAASGTGDWLWRYQIPFLPSTHCAFGAGGMSSRLPSGCRAQPTNKSDHFGLCLVVTWVIVIIIALHAASWAFSFLSGGRRGVPSEVPSAQTYSNDRVSFLEP